MKVAIGDNSQLRETNFMVPVTRAAGVKAAPSELATAKHKVNRAECTLEALQRQLAKAKEIPEDPVDLNDHGKEKRSKKNTTARSIGSLAIIRLRNSFPVTLHRFARSWMRGSSMQSFYVNCAAKQKVEETKRGPVWLV